MLTHIGNVYPHISPTLCYHTLWQCLPIYITHLMLPHTPAMFSHVYITHLMLPHTRATFSHIYHPLYVTAPFGNIFPYIYISPTLCYHTLGQHFPIYISPTLLHTRATFSHIYHPYTGWVIVSCPSQKCFNPITCVSVSQPLGFQQPDNHRGPSKGNW